MAIQPPKDPPSTPEGGINNPDLTKDVKVQIKAITDEKQAYTIAENLRTANQDRNKTDAIIYSKYSGSPPYDDNALRQAGQSERYNFPTGFLASIVDRVTPVPIQLIDSARY